MRIPSVELPTHSELPPQPVVSERPVEHNWEHVLLALEAADEAARESGLKEARSRLAVRNPIGMTVDGIAWAAEWTGDAGLGIRGAVDRAEEALRHERELSLLQRGLGRAGSALGRLWKPAGEYFSERAGRIGEALQNARSAQRNKPVLLATSGALGFVSERLTAIAERLDRSRIA